MLKYVVVLLFCLCEVSYSNIQDLKYIYNKAKVLYSGTDNNYVSGVIRFNDIEGEKITDPNMLKSYISKCIFMTNGAYGDHISENTQKYITNALSNELYKFSFTYKVATNKFDLEDEIFSSPCILVISDYQNNSLLLQSFSYD